MPGITPFRWDGSFFSIHHLISENINMVNHKIFNMAIKPRLPFPPQSGAGTRLFTTGNHFRWLHGLP
jgi:hypothetical protein